MFQSRIVDAGGERPAAADDEAAVRLARRGRRRARSRRRSARPGWRPTPRAGSRDRSSRGSSDGRRGCRRSRPWTGSRARSPPGCRRPPRSRAPCRRRPSAGGSGTARSRAAAARSRGCSIARVLGPLRALAQDRHDLARPPHRLVVADGGEIAPHRLRQRAHGVALLARAGHDHLPQTILHFRPDLRRGAFPCKAFRCECDTGRSRAYRYTLRRYAPENVCARAAGKASPASHLGGGAPACQGPCTAACRPRQCLEPEPAHDRRCPRRAYLRRRRLGRRHVCDLCLPAPGARHARSAAAPAADADHLPEILSLGLGRDLAAARQRLLDGVHDLRRLCRRPACMST